jgi:hypothetical protein
MEGGARALDAVRRRFFCRNPGDFRDADFKLKASVDFVLLELGQLGVETIDVVLGCHLSAKIRNGVFARAMCLTMNPSISPRSLSVIFFGPYAGSISQCPVSLTRRDEVRPALLVATILICTARSWSTVMTWLEIIGIVGLSVAFAAAGAALFVWSTHLMP